MPTCAIVVPRGLLEALDGSGISLARGAAWWSCAQGNSQCGAEQPRRLEIRMSNATAVTDADFATAVEGNSGLTVVDFWATWCAPCRMIAPILDQLAGEFAGSVKVTKLDVDTNQKTAARFNVRSI